MTPSLRIAPARAEDARDVIDYCNSVGGESDNLTFGAGEFACQDVEAEAERLRATAASPAAASLLGWVDAPAGRRLVAMADTSAGHRARTLHHAEFGLSVRKAWWHHGFGAQMLDALVAEVSAMPQITVLALKVRPDNEYAIRLYLRHGFEKTGVDRAALRIDGRYVDLLMMSRFL